MTLSPGYRAAREGVAWFPRPDRVLWRIEGRAPSAMLKGMVTGALPLDLAPNPTGRAPSLLSGRAPYSLILTPKGRPLTDLRLYRLTPGEGGALLMELASAGVDATTEHFTRYLPPRMARVVGDGEALALATVAGPQAAAVLAELALRGLIEPGELEAMTEGDEWVLEDGSPVGLRVVRSEELHVQAWDLLATEVALQEVLARMEGAGAVRGSEDELRALRLEKGRPAYGIDLDQDVLPPEAGLQQRAIDHAKGCYTGQEVIVRIRDRGQVNRHLRGLLLGPGPIPEPGTPLFAEGRERAAGEVRSAVWSPLVGGGIALAYVRREVEVPGTIRLGSATGPEVTVRSLEPEGWIPASG